MWQGTGETVQVAGHVDRVPEFDKRTGDHLWIMLACWRVDPAKLARPLDGPSLLDSENMLTLNGPGCYFCEQIYSPRLATRRCKGTP
jgi:hypothetical protein